MPKQKIAQNLIEIRTAAGLTQDDVAKALEISNRTISKWETGTSLPDLPMLIKLAKFYKVSSDEILGLTATKTQGIQQAVCTILEDVDRREGALKAFEIERAIAPALVKSKSFKSDEENKFDDTLPYYPTDPKQQYTSTISTKEMYFHSVCSDAVNLTISLFRNKENFAWMKAPDAQSKIVRLLRFLANEDALTLLCFIHSDNCSESFTADYVAEHTNLTKESVQSVLNELASFYFCKQITAHCLDGAVKIYSISSTAILLSIVSLVYAEMADERFIRAYCCKRPEKIIGGSKQ